LIIGMTCFSNSMHKIYSLFLFVELYSLPGQYEADS
jgi:hypothetical protein